MFVFVIARSPALLPESAGRRGNLKVRIAAEFGIATLALDLLRTQSRGSLAMTIYDRRIN